MRERSSRTASGVYGAPGAKRIWASRIRESTRSLPSMRTAVIVGIASGSRCRDAFQARYSSSESA